MPGNDQSTTRVLQAAAYVVVVAWGIKTASHILSIIFIALLLTYVILPFPKWLMRRFQFPKALAIPMTLVFVATIYLVISLALVEASFQLREKMPLYVEHFRTLYERIAVFLSAHGIRSAQLSLKNMYSSDRIIGFARMILPTVVGLVSDRLLISLLSLIFLIEMADPEGAKTGPLARNLAYYGGDVQAFITISAKTGAINAMANLVILIALGVDFPVVWCVLYFFLHFIPNVGFLFSLVPPTLMALLMLGWKRALLVVTMLIVFLTAGVSLGFSQTSAALQNYLGQTLGQSQDQIAAIRGGQPYAVNLESRSPAEIFVFGVVYINANPESYVKFASDFKRLRQVPGYLAIRNISNPAQLWEFEGFSFYGDDIKALKECKPGKCGVQLPGATIEQLRQSVNWSASNVDEQVNQFVQKLAMQRIQLYQKEGSRPLGAVYNDKKQQVNVSDQFQYILSYTKALPENLPSFYNYILNYPDSKPANVESTFYWDSVKFGLKPTLRIVQVFTLKGNTPQEPAYAIAEKQLYSSHYFETALDLSFCIRDGNDPTKPGFYLVQVMGSEQAGLTGFEGSIIRKVAVGRSVSDLQKTLATIKSTLEHEQ